MRTLKLQVQLSVDGYIAGPNGEMDWLVWNWDDALKAYVGALTEPVDTILLGRKLAEGFIPAWDAYLNSPEPVDGAQKMVETPKVVFTKTITESPWENVAVANGELVAEITALKQQTGGDLIAYGGGTFVSSLIEAGLIDEYHLFVNPVALGQGMPIFKSLAQQQPLTLVKATAFACGIVVLHYTLRT
ncbi:MAG: dihydrofolate reductase family protein [Spirosomataceae bacterium]